MGSCQSRGHSCNAKVAQWEKHIPICGSWVASDQMAGLNNAVFLTLYSKPYAAVYSFQPLGTGTMILIAVILTAIFLAVSPRLFFLALADTWKQLRSPS